MSKKYLAMFKVSIDIHLDRQQMEEANRVLNIKFLGRPRFKSLQEKASKEHEEASYAANRHYRTLIDVGLCEDGRLEMVPSPGVAPGSQASET